MIIEENIAKDEKSEYNYLKEGTQTNIKRTPKDDVIFKLLFGKTQNEHLLKDFLEALLEIKIHIVELPKFRKALPDLNNKLDQWLVFLDHENEEWINMATEKNNEVKEAQEELDKILAERQTAYIQYLLDKGEMDRATENDYYLEKGLAEGKVKGLAEGKAEGLAEGKAEGLAEGKAEEKVEIAKNLLKAGTPIEVISSATGLSIDEIQKLQYND